ncbi:unnamed protein product [Wickerhamomyces anomalus]
MATTKQALATRFSFMTDEMEIERRNAKKTTQRLNIPKSNPITLHHQSQDTASYHQVSNFEEQDNPNSADKRLNNINWPESIQINDFDSFDAGKINEYPDTVCFEIKLVNSSNKDVINLKMVSIVIDGFQHFVVLPNPLFIMFDPGGNKNLNSFSVKLHNLAGQVISEMFNEGSNSTKGSLAFQIISKTVNYYTLRLKISYWVWDDEKLPLYPFILSENFLMVKTKGIRYFLSYYWESFLDAEMFPLYHFILSVNSLVVKTKAAKKKIQDLVKRFVFALITGLLVFDPNKHVSSSTMFFMISSNTAIYLRCCLLFTVAFYIFKDVTVLIDQPMVILVGQAMGVEKGFINENNKGLLGALGAFFISLGGIDLLQLFIDNHKYFESIVPTRLTIFFGISAYSYCVKTSALHNDLVFVYSFLEIWINFLLYNVLRDEKHKEK